MNEPQPAPEMGEAIETLFAKLGLPDHAEHRYYDTVRQCKRRSNAWFWACGCSAEPLTAQYFSVSPCQSHRSVRSRRRA